MLDEHGVWVYYTVSVNPLHLECEPLTVWIQCWQNVLEQPRLIRVNCSTACSGGWGYLGDWRQFSLWSSEGSSMCHFAPLPVWLAVSGLTLFCFTGLVFHYLFMVDPLCPDVSWDQWCYSRQRCWYVLYWIDWVSFDNWSIHLRWVPWEKSGLHLSMRDQNWVRWTAAASSLYLRDGNWVRQIAAPSLCLGLWLLLHLSILVRDWLLLHLSVLETDYSISAS